MAEFGRATLILAFGVALYAVAAGLHSARSQRHVWASSARRAIYALLVLLSLAIVILEAAFLRSDFSFGLVADNSSTTTSTFYKLTAMWSSQSGSLLLWVWLLALFSSLVLHATRRKHRELAPYATAVLGGLATFFTALLVFEVSPFTTLANPPAEGAGLNPLLRHPMMMFHPLALYSGYVGFSIPFAFAIGALVTRRLDAEWIRSTRRYALIAWSGLALGLVFGARWSYVELGWGGYWGWDPVENAALMPFLTGTALLHSVMVQERRGMLRVWNVSLVVATFVLALLGTFLVRSGILSSIHAFGASTVGGYFFALIALVLVGAAALIVSRLDDLRSPAGRIESFLSRESFFLVQNLVLVGFCIVVLWGTFFPLVSEAVTGTKSSVGPPWFDRYTVPFGIVLVLLTGVGPLLPWRGSTRSRLRRSFALPAAAATCVAIGLIAFTNVRSSIPSLAVLTFAAFTLAAVGTEVWRGTRARRLTTSEPYPTALVSLVRGNRRRYGGYVVHAGVAVLLLGVAASSAFSTQRDVRMRPGETARVAGYDVRYLRPTSKLSNEKIEFGAVLDVRKDGKRVALLQPGRSYFPSQNASLGTFGRFFEGNSTSEIGLQAGPTRDIWTAIQPDLGILNRPIRIANRRFARSDPNVQGLIIAFLAQVYVRKGPPATFRLNVNPMVTSIWGGAIIALSGALLALWPAGAAARRRVTGVAAARLGRVPSHA